MDYSQYHLSVSDWTKIIGCSAGITAVVSYLFYDSWIGMLGSFICIYFLQKIWKTRRIEKQKKQLTKQFQDAVQLVGNSLLSGCSMENAWSDAHAELGKLYGRDACMCQELLKIKQSLALNVPLEELLADFATRSGIDEIQSFSEVFSFAKRGGGNLVMIIENTVNHMRARLEVEQEIDVLVASKKLEQNILNVVPLFILAYLKMSSGEYMDILYRNSFGIMFMTGCLAVYLFAIIVSKKILDIRM